MVSFEDLHNIENNYICYFCISEDYLVEEILRNNDLQFCSYCGQIRFCIPIIELADYIEQAFEEHYQETSCQPSELDIFDMQYDDNYWWEPEGLPILDAITHAAELSDIQAASDLQKILSYRYYDFDCLVEFKFNLDSLFKQTQPKANPWNKKWLDFERSLKTETRFFSQSASLLLKSIFNNIDKVKTDNGKSLIVNAGPNTKFEEVYRARCFQSERQLIDALQNPSKSFGAPPSDIAGAGRMNAQGISVFYGAKKQEVALAEIRPPVGSKVVVAKFKIIRNLKLLDLTALGSAVVSTGSVFDPTYFERVTKTMFLRTLNEKMTVPVMSNNETLEYLTTQAVADFLASENIPQFDGIIFNSVQAKDEALNIVFFHKASSVEKEHRFKVRANSTDRLKERASDEWDPNQILIDDWSPKDGDPSYILVDDEAEEIRNYDKWVSDDDNRDEVKPSYDKPEDWLHEDAAKLSKKQQSAYTVYENNSFDMNNFNQINTSSSFDTTQEDINSIPSLKIDIDSIEIHHVESVQFKSKLSSIARERSVL